MTGGIRMKGDPIPCSATSTNRNNTCTNWYAEHLIKVKSKSSNISGKFHMILGLSHLAAHGHMGFSSQSAAVFNPCALYTPDLNPPDPYGPSHLPCVPIIGRGDKESPWCQPMRSNNNFYASIWNQDTLVSVQILHIIVIPDTSAKDVIRPSIYMKGGKCL